MNFDLSPTQTEYVFSNATVNVLVGNTGEGKTHASVVAMPVHAQRCGRPIRAAIVRDTHENIKTSTARSIQDVFIEDPAYISFHNDFKQLTIHSDPPVQADLFGIDDLGALSKLQGPEYALIWLEEPAPMADKVNAGLKEEVFNAALVRAARQKGTKPRVQVSMNPADDMHWTHRRFIEEPDVDPDLPLITKRVWFMKYGENRYVSEDSRQAVKKAYKNDAASYARYVLGQFATIYRGKKVTPEYSGLIHLAPGPLIPAFGLNGFAFFDSWHNPSCVLGQITTVGRLIFLDTLRLEGGDIRTLLKTQVFPMLNSPRWKDKCRAWRVGGDCTMKQPDQSNKQESAARVVAEAFKIFGGSPVFEPGPTKWGLMRGGIKNALNTNVMGMPAVYLSGDNKLLHKGLNGAWHYAIDNSGMPKSDIPEKDEFSHFCDAWANAVCVLLPTINQGASVNKYRQQQQRIKKRIQSYA